MLRIRTARDIDDFVGAPDDPPDYSETVRSLWESGAGRPEWSFIAEDETGRIGRLGLRVAPTTTEPDWLGSLPAEELFVFGLHLPWAEDEPGRALLSHAVQQVGSELPDMLEYRINASLHSSSRDRSRWAERLGMSLFQEKQGFQWVEDGTVVDVPGGLTFRSIEDAGTEAFRSAMAASGDGTLDRNDRYYWEGCGPENWAAQMMVYLVDEDAAMWLVGYRGDDAVGYVAVARDEDLGSTIAHIGVVPEHRGHGHVNRLLAAGTAAAQRAGIERMLSDVDVVNEPMMEAMRRGGHRDDQTDWHVWVYRARLVDLTMSTF